MEITAKQWRELGIDDALKSVQIAALVVGDELGCEALDEASTAGRIMQLLDLSAKFQGLAISVLQVRGGAQRPPRGEKREV